MKSISIIQKYAEKMKHYQELILDYLENEDSNENHYEDLIKSLNDQKIFDNKEEFKAILHLISRISNNHNRSNNFLLKIGNIIKTFQEHIKKYFTNYEIFNIFKDNKRILLFLFEEKLVIPDKSLAWIISNGKYNDQKYPQYFFTEFEDFFEDKFKKEIISNTEELSNNDFESYEINRKRGENSFFLSRLIQKDSVEEFVSFYNRSNFSLSSTIDQSIYETNAFLINKNPSLIEYSAFFGSIQIFKYLFINNVELTSSLWLYVIHSNNPELINFLEDNNIRPQRDTTNQCFDEAIKCHHINMMNYIKEFFYENENEHKFRLFSQSLHYYNFIDFCNNEYSFNDDITFDMLYQLCKYDYISIVDLLLKNKKVDINANNIHQND